jgi:hypothetical protein
VVGEAARLDEGERERRARRHGMIEGAPVGVMMVLRPGSKVCITTVSSRPGKSTLPFSCRMALPRTIEVQGTTAGHLARAVAGERNHGAAGAAPLVERARQTASTRARANDRNSEPAQADGRFKQAITSRSRQAPPCLVMRPSQDGWGAVMSLRRARRWRWGLLPGPDSLPGCSRRWSHRPRDRVERPEAGLGAGPPRTCPSGGF